MADKIILAQLDLDIEALLKATADSKEAVVQLKKELLALKDAGMQSSDAFKQTQANLEKLTKALDKQIEALKEQVKQNKSLADGQQQLSRAVNATAQAQENLNDVYDEAEGMLEDLTEASQDAARAIQQVNQAMATQNTAMNQAEGATGKGKKTMQEYKDMVVESFESINIFNGGITGFTTRAQEAGGTLPLFKNAFNGITTGIKGMGAAITANPAGVILKVIVLVVQELYNAFKSYAPLMNMVQSGMAAVGAVFESVKNSVIGLVTGATSLGDFFSNFGSDAVKAAKDAVELKNSQEELANAMKKQELANQKAGVAIEGFIETSKNAKLSEEERLKALKSAQDVEMKNYRERKKLAEDTYKEAADKIALGRNLTKEEIRMLHEKGDEYIEELAKRKSLSQEEIDALHKAQLDRDKIFSEEVKITAKYNDMAEGIHKAAQQAQEDRNRKAKELQQKRLDDAIEKQKQLLDLYVVQNDVEGKALAERLKFEEDYARKSKAILDAELKAKKISQIQYRAEVAKIDLEMRQNQAQLTADHARAMIELDKSESKSMLEGVKVLTTELVEEEKKRLNSIFKQEIEALQLEKGLDAQKVKAKREAHQELTTEEAGFLTTINNLEEDHNSKINETDKAFEDNKKQQKEEADKEKAKEREAEYQKLIEDGFNKYEIEKEIEQDRYEDEVQVLAERKKTEELTEEEHQKQLAALDEKYKNVQKELDKNLVDFKLAQQTKLMGEMATILGRESKAGKAFAIAQATIDTYQAAVGAYRSQMTMDPSSPVRGAIAAAAAVATGLRNVQKIAGVKEPKFEKGGLMTIGGNRHSAGGTRFVGEDGTRFEAEQGELIGVMNRNAARHFMAFNNAFPSGGASAPNYFASGGIVSREISQKQFNMDELAIKIAEANRALPSPVVSVQDIITEGNSYVQVRNGANF